ncbi:nickel ABC transporter, nickel/metallophore periplasmic binding protein [Malaciobacter molluscorum LMG 25693]|uniref:Nickel ABC transporter, nickel/metallophore periplasmic binding protein n=1 Tax=Malaciobacter molluscorum LMG 25693 TaxID=870501 RepID=A0A2G1DJ67_9BACT|nr:nickel ABC transporter substrate-binding protein [Malaciobacter molluscorum]AXX91669.1 nickel ABC transporter, periplasmic substrate-binding protein [Malaciobacter molluscorum LMG 25693]PHO18537.1 nickel ABC transporter, nickel/metallophore periplasmic binding protein [Malaciobacter molluscorum LMG 25693]
MKLLLKTIFICITTLLFVACQSQKENKIKNELIYASTKDIRDINPHLYGGEMAAQNMVFESLVINTKNGIKPNLAKSWKISNNGKTYTFKLREDVKFSDGLIFDANVVKSNFDAILKNRVRHAWLELINEIISTKVIDKFTFELNLKNAYYPTLTELAMTRPFRFISTKCFKNNQTKNGVKCYVGTGPWILKEHKKNDYALFVRNNNYWNNKTKIEKIKWRVIPNHQSILLSLQKGEIDLIFGADGDMINSDAFSMLEKSNKVKTKLSNPIASRAILINTKREITKDLEVRKALEHAVNKQAIIKGILNNKETIANTLFSKTTPYCNIDLPIKNFNVNLAKKILDKDGWIINKDTNIREKDGKQLILKLYYNANNAQEKTISEYIQSNLKDIGIDLKIIGEEKQSFLDRQQNGNFDLQYSLSWGVPYDPQSYISSWRALSHGDYQAQLGLNKKEWLDKTISDILIETNKEKRANLYKEIFSYIHKEDVYIPISYSRTKVVYNPILKDVGFNLSQYEIPFEKMYFEKSK